MDGVRQLIGAQYESLADLTVATVRMLADWLGTRTPIERLSEWAPAAVLPADALQRFPDHRLSVPRPAWQTDRQTVPDALAFDPKITPWRQRFPGFHGDVSCLDLLFNTGPEARRYLTGE